MRPLIVDQRHRTVLCILLQQQREVNVLVLGLVEGSERRNVEVQLEVSLLSLEGLDPVKPVLVGLHALLVKKVVGGFALIKAYEELHFHDGQFHEQGFKLDQGVLLDDEVPKANLLFLVNLVI